MWKRILHYIAKAAYLFLSAYCKPIFLLTAFNYGKGIQNNEDGILFIPVGFVLIVVSVLLDVMVVRGELKRHKDSRRDQLFIVTVCIFIFAVSIILTFSAWETFFECLGHYRGLNLAPQG